DILKTKTPIPDNFLKLESETGNYCDIPHTIMKELDLPLGEDIPYPVYISPSVINRAPTFGGITIENKKEIIIDKPFSKDQECQTNLTEAKGNQNQELQDQITTLILNNRQTEIRRLNNALQTAQQEKEKVERDLKSNLLGLLFKNKQKNKRISELNSSLSFLRGLLADKNQEANDLEQRLIATDTLITNTQNLLGIDDLNNLPVLPEGETLITLIARPTQAQLQDKQNEVGRKNDEITELNRTIKKLEDEKKVLKDELDIEKAIMAENITLEQKEENRQYILDNLDKYTIDANGDFFNVDPEVLGEEYDYIKLILFDTENAYPNFFKNKET
ncbi:12944_t:CDS:2, partial [Racocetra fulgida]